MPVYPPKQHCSLLFRKSRSGFLYRRQTCCKSLALYLSLSGVQFYVTVFIIQPRLFDNNSLITQKSYTQFLKPYFACLDFNQFLPQFSHGHFPPSSCGSLYNTMLPSSEGEGKHKGRSQNCFTSTVILK